LLQEILIEKHVAIQKHIDERATLFRQRDHDYADLTVVPLAPTDAGDPPYGFRSAVTEYLPTPPASVSSDTSAEVEDVQSSQLRPGHDDSVAVRYTSPTRDGSGKSQPSFRRRIGRGGRVLIDRRGLHVESTNAINPHILERFKYDRDDDDEDLTYVVDRFDTMSMFFRASFMGSSRAQNGLRTPHVQGPRPGIREAVAAGVPSG
jgi:enhancer of polycomb-like protein